MTRTYNASWSINKTMIKRIGTVVENTTEVSIGLLLNLLLLGLGLLLMRLLLKQLLLRLGLLLMRLLLELLLLRLGDITHEIAKVVTVVPKVGAITHGIDVGTHVSKAVTGVAKVWDITH